MKMFGFTKMIVLAVLFVSMKMVMNTGLDTDETGCA